MSLDALIKSLPKTELHLHIEGTLEAEMMLELAQRNNISLPYHSVEEVRKQYDFKNLQSFLDLYYAGASVLVTEQDFYDLTVAYLDKCLEQHIVHTEIFFDPQTHTERGIRFDTVLYGIKGALDEYKKSYGLSSRLIMCFLKHLPVENSMETLNTALLFKDQIDGVGLDSTELGNPPSKFTSLIKKARENGLHTVSHTGEEGGPEYIWETINSLDIERIDHGVRCSDDPELVRYLAETGIPLTVCPLSNVRLKVFESLEKHNLKRLLEKGLCVTINSDDPAYFGGYLVKNMTETAKALSLDHKDIFQLVKNGINASLMDDQEKYKQITRAKGIYQIYIHNHNLVV